LTESHHARGECWQVAEPDNLLWAQFGQEFVGYHRPSGKTHFLNDVSVRVLSGYLLVPLSTEALADKLGAESGNGEPLPSDELHALLIRFEQLGLVKRVAAR
jgi:PqqD family protein of HPr-rel-A system